ncbi:6-phosphogluconolactonase [Zophobihabitans entericus]|uniref:6-phosphogluconolactonase n=1 Tax=Zophobihabitans entericus TaxID=1635327 RepID=A0A6G9IAU3_9GAMM|nr:6-phosphogluconolactonase [Zophobihabitans entericus]QIQ20952.1 6-phosphogluconolactonase [Zophobihabitans entericus]
MYKLNEYASPEKLNQDLATNIVAQLKLAIARKGHGTLAVSGGKTPIGLFQLLSQQSLEWDKVYITLVDDRWVDSHDDASNEKLVNTYLLQNKAKSAHFVGLKNSTSNPFDGAAQAEKNLRDKIPLPFDVLILGMGEDGHTASLFPHAENLKNGLNMTSGKLLVGMMPLTAPLERITLTLPAILSSNNIYLHLVGASKKEVLTKAQQGKDVVEMPVRSILQQDKVPVTIFWTA